MSNINFCDKCHETHESCTCDETMYECENCGCISFVQKGKCKECKLSSPTRKVVNKNYVQDEILKSTLPQSWIFSYLT